MSVPSSTTVDPNGQTLTSLQPSPTDPSNQGSQSAGAGTGSGGTQETSTPTQERSSSSSGVDWIRQALRPLVQERPVEREAEKVAEPESTDQSSKDAKTAAGAEPANKGLTLTDEELDRRIQSEVDRREAKRTEQADRQRLKDLRQNNPYEFAREMERREAEATDSTPAEAAKFAEEQVLKLDRLVLDPITHKVADSPEKARLLQNIKPGPEGRGEYTKSMLDLLWSQAETAGMSKARETLLNDPVFVKQVLALHGGQRAEPDVVSAAGAAPHRVDSDSEMNGFLRGARRR